MLLDNESVVADRSGGSSDDGSDSVADGDYVVDEADENNEENDEIVLPASGVSKPPSDIAMLKLQIKLAEQNSATMVRLAELEVEKMKLATNSSVTTISNTVCSVKSKIDQSVKGLLPQMGGNGDSLNFFHVFERTLEMHDVDKQQWSYYSPSCLNARAMKVYARLTLEQCKVYESVKQEILV